MDVVLLGKTIKAMYKLSGKTLTQLSDETDLTVDTINNLFYARLQKPSYLGITALVKATGYTVAELSGFLEMAESLSSEADITDEFTKYLFSVKDTTPVAEFAKNCTANADNTEPHVCCMQVKELNEEHEKQLDRFRATHLHYVEQLQERYKEQIAQMTENAKNLKEHYDHSVGEIKKSHLQEMERQDREIRTLKRLNLFLTLALIVVAVGAVAIALIIKG